MTTSIFSLSEKVEKIKIADFDFDCGHKILTSLMTVLQIRFKEETKYNHPLMPPQANIVFALDPVTATHMIKYMSSKLIAIGGFEGNEFRFVCKSGDKEGLQRLRLEFNEGINSKTIEKLEKLTNELAKVA